MPARRRHREDCDDQWARSEQSSGETARRGTRATCLDAPAVGTGARNHGRTDKGSARPHLRIRRQKGEIDTAAIQRYCLTDDRALAAFHIGKSR